MFSAKPSFPVSPFKGALANRMICLSCGYQVPAFLITCIFLDPLPLEWVGVGWKREVFCYAEYISPFYITTCWTRQIISSWMRMRYVDLLQLLFTKSASFKTCFLFCEEVSNARSSNFPFICQIDEPLIYSWCQMDALTLFVLLIFTKSVCFASSIFKIGPSKRYESCEQQN